MPFVLDASIAACWAFEDEVDPVATFALAQLSASDAVVPCLWWFELRNTLIVNERRGRISERDTAAFLKKMTEFVITIDREPDEAAVLHLARRHRLTVYDAAYLELAQRDRLALATLDAALAKAARAVNVALLRAEH